MLPVMVGPFASIPEAKVGDCQWESLAWLVGLRRSLVRYRRRLEEVRAPFADFQRRLLLGRLLCRWGELNQVPAILWVTPPLPSALATHRIAQSRLH
jgi:hypothetical protein